MKAWDKTRRNYINWVTNTDLRYEFGKKIKFEDLSLWWITKLVDRDNVNEPEWYLNLNKKLNRKESNVEKNNFSIFLLILKVIKNFSTRLIFVIFIKLFFSKRKIPNKKTTCLYAILLNFRLIGKKYVDYQYGKFGINDSRNKVYFLDLQENLNLFINYFNIRNNLKKIPFDYVIEQHNISIVDLFKIYISTIVNLILTLKILKKKNYFFINKINCERILKQKLIESYFGSIQDHLLKGYALKNTLRKLSCRNFVTYFEFFPRSRSIYYFAKKAMIKNIISIQHGNPHDNHLVLNIKKNDYSKEDLNNFYSPKPDVICCQGEKYFKKMKKIFPRNKIYKVGSFKIELSKNKIKPPKKKKFKKLKQKNKILIIAGLYDWASFVTLLNKCKLDNFDIFLCPHPVKNRCLGFFKENFKHRFKTVNPDFHHQLTEKDYIIFGNSSLGIEVAIKKHNAFRVYDKEFIASFDPNQEIVTATNSNTISNILKRRIYNNSSFLKKNYFFKYDRSASNLLEKILKKL